MTYLKLSLLSVSLAALMLGCGTESDEPPLVPEIISIEIDETDTNSSVHSLDDPLQLSATVVYSDGPNASVDSQLSWESNDTNITTVFNGLVTAQANHGTAAISASYRNKFITTADKNITIIPLLDVIITSSEAPIIDINYTTVPASADINTNGTYKLSADGSFELTSIKSISSNITWTSSNITIASIDSTGSLTVNEVNGVVDISVSVYNEVNTTLKLNITTAP